MTLGWVSFQYWPINGHLRFHHGSGAPGPPPRRATTSSGPSDHGHPHHAPYRSPALGEFAADRMRSEEHTSELQSRQYLVCRLLLEKKKIKNKSHDQYYDTNQNKKHEL